MMNRLGYIAVVLVALATSACTTRIHADYPQYLADNEAKVVFPHVADSVQYYLDPATEKHSEKFRLFLVGAANSWVVDFGRILDATMQGNDIRTAFDNITKVSDPDDVQGLLLRFSLDSYEFVESRARVFLNITSSREGRQLSSKTYFALGEKQLGKMFFGGAFAMKTAVQQSTKAAVDKILTKFIADLRKITNSGVAFPLVYSFDLPGARQILGLTEAGNAGPPAPGPSAAGSDPA